MTWAIGMALGAVGRRKDSTGKWERETIPVRVTTWRGDKGRELVKIRLSNRLELALSPDQAITLSNLLVDGAESFNKHWGNGRKGNSGHESQ